MTDTELLDALERILLSGGTVLECQPDETCPFQVFSIASQHQRGHTARELLEVVADFHDGRRDYQAEEWAGMGPIRRAYAKQLGEHVEQTLGNAMFVAMENEDNDD